MVTGQFRVFTVAAGGHLTLDRVRVSHGNVDGDGGGIHNAGTLILQNGSVVTGNIASGSGGGIYNSGTLQMTGGCLVGNTAPTSSAVHSTVRVTISGVWWGRASGPGDGAVNDRVTATNVQTTAPAGCGTTPDPPTSGCTATINLSAGVTQLNVRLTPQISGRTNIVGYLHQGDPISVKGRYLTWYLIDAQIVDATTGQRVTRQGVWIGVPDAVVLSQTCSAIPALDATGNPVTVTFDYPLGPPPADGAWRRLPCTAQNTGSSNWVNCARIVYDVYYSRFVALNGKAPTMSNLLAAIYRNEISALFMSGAPAMGVNQFAGVSQQDIAVEVHRANYWSVINQQTNCGTVSATPPTTLCNHQLTPDQITTHYLVQVQSWYQLANTGNISAKMIEDVETDLITSAAPFTTYGVNALSQRWSVTNRPRQWGNYAYSKPGYASVYTHPNVAYCYTVREFHDNQNPDEANYPTEADTWNDYRFAIITARSLGFPTSTYDMRTDYRQRPPWLDQKVTNTDGKLVPYRNTFGGRVALPCNA